MFRGENATCNGALLTGKIPAGNDPEKVKELWQQYHAKRRQEIMTEKKKTYNQIKVGDKVLHSVLDGELPQPKRKDSLHRAITNVPPIFLLNNHK